MVREKGKISVISGIRAESVKAEAPGRFLQKDGSYLSAKPKVGEGRLATGPPSLLVLLVLCPVGKDLALVV